MKKVDAGQFHRLVKAAMDSGEAASLEEAMQLFSTYRLRLHLGDGWNSSCAKQAAVATIVNTATRVFLGGVYLSGGIDGMFSIPLLRHKKARQVAETYGAMLYDEKFGSMPMLIVGESNGINESVFSLDIVTSGWIGGVTPTGSENPLLASHDFSLAGIAAASIAVSEAFIYVRNEHPAAGFRSIGISLWEPGNLEWTGVDAQGPVVEFLPDSLWLVGLGHLGQAYAWAIGMLPYQTPNKVQLYLQDFDIVETSNISTCVFVGADDVGKRKTRVVAEQLDSLGFNTSIHERFMESGNRVQRGEPKTALIGVDNVVARKDAEQYGFDKVIEAGLGGGYRDFRKMRLHMFPGPNAATDIWRNKFDHQENSLAPAYRDLLDVTEDECGVTQLASRSVGTPYVGVFAASLVLAELIRSLHGGNQYSVIDLCLRDMKGRSVVESAEYDMNNLGFSSAA